MNFYRIVGRSRYVTDSADFRSHNMWSVNAAITTSSYNSIRCVRMEEL